MTGPLGIIGLSAGLLAFSSAVPYVKDIVWGKTRPERVSWLIWSSLSVIALLSQMAQGVTWGLAVTGGDTLATVLIFVLSITYGVGGWTKRDLAALAVAMAGLVVWIVIRQPIAAIVAVVAA